MWCNRRWRKRHKSYLCINVCPMPLIFLQNIKSRKVKFLKIIEILSQEKGYMRKWWKNPAKRVRIQTHRTQFQDTKNLQFSSVTQLCPTLCNPMNHSTPGLPVHHQLPESTQTHVHWVSDAIQPSHPLSYPSPALNLSQHHLFKWVSSSHQMAKVLEFQLQYQSFQWTPRTDLL